MNSYDWNLARKPYLEDPDFLLYNGDVREVLREMPANTVDCALTSPPFYGLRDYGTGQWEGGSPDCDHAVRQDVKIASSTLGGGKATTGHQREGYKATCGRCGAKRVDMQIGLEESPDVWAWTLTEAFAELRRVLKPEGTLWIECGDSYCSGTGADRFPTTAPGPDVPSSWATRSQPQRIRPVGDAKPKDLMGTPWVLAFGLRADGWWLRQAIIWHKPNAMPESATDRCTTAHSYVFLLSKSARYWFDAQAIGEDFSPLTNSRGSGTGPKQAQETKGGTLNAGRVNSSFGAALRDLPHMRRTPQAEVLEGLWECVACGVLKTKTAESAAEGCGVCGGVLALVSGEASRGPDGRRVTHVKQGENSVQHRDGERWPNELRNPRSVWTIPTSGYPEAHFATWPEALVERIIKAGCPEGGVVLDPFMGSGTTALVARKLGRKSVGIELNPDYCELAAKRLSQLSLLADERVA